MDGMTDATLMMSILAMDAYNEGSQAGLALPPRTPNVDGAQIGLSYTDTLTGFYALDYTWNGNKVVSIRGTDNKLPSADPLSIGDILGGWVSGAGILGGQALDTAVAYQQFTGQSIFGGLDRNVILTGHSLGGGLAGMVAALTGD